MTEIKTVEVPFLSHFYKGVTRYNVTSFNDVVHNELDSIEFKAEINAFLKTRNHSIICIADKFSGYKTIRSLYNGDIVWRRLTDYSSIKVEFENQDDALEFKLRFL